jgi:hypothetical protein
VAGDSHYRATGSAAYRASGDARGIGGSDADATIEDEWTVSISAGTWTYKDQSGDTIATFTPTVTIPWEGIKYMLRGIFLLGTQAVRSDVKLRSVEDGGTFDPTDTAALHPGFTIQGDSPRRGHLPYSFQNDSAGTGPYTCSISGVGDGVSNFNITLPDIGGYVILVGPQDATGYLLAQIDLGAPMVRAYNSTMDWQLDVTLTRVGGGLTDEGGVHLLNIMFGAPKSAYTDSPWSTIREGAIDDTGFTGYVQTDTWASHGWQAHVGTISLGTKQAESNGRLVVQTVISIFDTDDSRGSFVRGIQSGFHLVSAGDYNEGILPGPLTTVTVDRTVYLNKP